MKIFHTLLLLTTSVFYLSCSTNDFVDIVDDGAAETRNPTTSTANQGLAPSSATAIDSIIVLGDYNDSTITWSFTGETSGDITLTNPGGATIGSGTYTLEKLNPDVLVINANITNRNITVRTEFIYEQPTSGRFLQKVSPPISPEGNSDYFGNFVMNSSAANIEEIIPPGLGVVPEEPPAE